MEKRINLLGSDVHYWEFNAGASPTIVMIHGFRGTHHGLQYVVDNLPGVHIIVPDLPGFDASSPMTERPHNIVGYRDFTEAFIAKLDLKKPPILLGHSFGSIVTAAVAAHNPKYIHQLILVNAIASPTKDAVFSWVADIFYWLGHNLPEKAGRALLGNPLIVRSITIMLAKTNDKTLRKLIHQNHLQYFSTFRSRQTLNEAYKAGISHTATQYAKDISTSTLVIAGENDDIAPLAGQKKLIKTLQKGTLIVLPDVGHLVHYEKPAEVAAAIRDFIRS